MAHSKKSYYFESSQKIIILIGYNKKISTITYLPCKSYETCAIYNSIFYIFCTNKATVNLNKTIFSLSVTSLYLCTSYSLLQLKEKMKETKEEHVCVCVLCLRNCILCNATTTIKKSIFLNARI